MIKPLTIRDIEIGTGVPKIIVPIVGKTQKEILSDAKTIVEIGAELIEWRADFYDEVRDEQKIKETLHVLRLIIGDIPLIFTIRTAAEGGQLQISGSDYADLLTFIASVGDVDIIDVELFKEGLKVEQLVQDLHTHETYVIMSNHDFHATPAKDEIISRLRKMQELGADLPKIAVMPNSSADVLTLLSATEEMASKYADRPLVTMSMGGVGSISRLSGEIFGSSMTFGSAGKSSAPGQISVSELKQSLLAIHSSLNKS
ncbi:MAG: type I 3-dehydroquinate dehydratase [Anaerolineaceae bacterium]|nr:type I 3-dehydroquinate dehydratase [Anaerolineaceae bacterium]